MRCHFTWHYFRADSTRMTDHFTVILQMFSQLIFSFHFCVTFALKWASEKLLFTVKDMNCVVFVSKRHLALFAKKLGFFKIRHHMSINFGWGSTFSAARTRIFRFAPILQTFATVQNFAQLTFLGIIDNLETHVALKVLLEGLNHCLRWIKCRVWSWDF